MIGPSLWHWETKTTNITCTTVKKQSLSCVWCLTLKKEIPNLILKLHHSFLNTNNNHLLTSATIRALIVKNDQSANYNPCSICYRCTWIRKCGLKTDARTFVCWNWSFRKKMPPCKQFNCKQNVRQNALRNVDIHPTLKRTPRVLWGVADKNGEEIRNQMMSAAAVMMSSAVTGPPNRLHLHQSSH